MELLKASNPLQVFFPWLILAKITGLHPFKVVVKKNICQAKCSLLGGLYSSCIFVVLLSIFFWVVYHQCRYNLYNIYDLISILGYVLNTSLSILIHIICAKNIPKFVSLPNKFLNFDNSFGIVGPYGRDKKILLLKMCVIFILLGASYFHSFFHFIGDQSFPILACFTDAIVSLNTNIWILQVIETLRLLEKRFEWINLELIELRLSQLRTTHRVNLLRRLYDDLFELAMFISQLYGMQMVLYTLVNFIVIVSNSYYTYVTTYDGLLKQDMPFLVFYDTFSTALQFCVSVFLLVRGFGNTTGEAGKTAVLVEKLLLNPNEELYKEEVWILSGPTNRNL